MNSERYKQLIVWQEIHKFVLEIYQASDSFPKHELYGITSQLRRAAVSVELNLVEGHAKLSIKDCLRYLNISDSSLRECAVILELGRDLRYLSEEQYDLLILHRRKIGYLLGKFIIGTKKRAF